MFRAFAPGGTLLIASLLAAPAAAQGDSGLENPLSLSGSVRLRYELVDNPFRPGQPDSDDIFNVRTILGAEYDAGPIQFGAELYDSRAYSADPATVSTSIVNTLELVQAWVAADLGGGARVKAGRFTMDLGSRRSVADDTFRNTTNGFTGVRGDWKGESGAAATLFLALPQRRLPDDTGSLLDNEVEIDRESFDTIFWGGIGSLPIAGMLAEAGYYRFRERDGDTRATRDRRLHTISARLLREPEAGRFDFEAEGAYQFGSIRASSAHAAAVLDVSAWFYHVEIGRRLGGPWRPRLSIEYDRASGDGPGGGFGRYDTLYGSRSGDFGPSGIYGPLNRTNISSPGLRVEAEPNNRLDIYISWRALWAEEPADAFSTSGVRDPAGASGSFAGHHIEGRLRYWAVPDHLRLELNAALLAKRRLLRDAPDAPTNGDTRYIALSATANF